MTISGRLIKGFRKRVAHSLPRALLQSKRIRRLGVYCLADEDSALDAKLFEGIHYGFHEYGLVEGAPHIMPVPLGPTVDFGLINPAVQATPSSFRFQGCMFKVGVVSQTHHTPPLTVTVHDC